MTFRLDSRHGLKRQVRRLLAGECAQAMRDLRSADDPVHALRRHAKRSRALLRLVRPALAKRDFRRADHAWRDLARAWSARRDDSVAAAIVARIGRRYADRLAPGLVARVRAGVLADAAPDAPDLRRARGRLRDLRERLRVLPMRSGWSHAFSGYARSRAAFLATGRQARRHARLQPRHAWRKRTKDLAHHLHLLGRLWPGVMEGLEAQLDELGTALGDERDLVATRRRLSGVRGAAPLRACALRWRRHLRERVAELERRLRRGTLPGSARLRRRT